MLKKFHDCSVLLLVRFLILPDQITARLSIECPLKYQDVRSYKDNQIRDRYRITDAFSESPCPCDMTVTISDIARRYQ